MLNTRHLIQALEAAGANHNIVYLSVPITSGRLEIALMERLKIRSPVELRKSYKSHWLNEVVGPNSDEALKIASHIRSFSLAKGRIVVDPSRMNIEGWDQHDYNSFWIDLMKGWVEQLVAGPGWEYSRGARGEVAFALELGIAIIDPNGSTIPPKLVNESAEPSGPN